MGNNYKDADMGMEARETAQREQTEPKLDGQDSQTATETATTPDPNLLDSQSFYYQDPATGAASTHPLTIRQLIPLLIPIREGISPILPPTVRCLKHGENEWKPAHRIPILKEAGAFWYVNTFDNPNFPHSCRSLLEIFQDSEERNHRLPMLHSPGVSPEWTSLAKLPHLQLVIQALQQQQQEDWNSQYGATTPVAPSEQKTRMEAMHWKGCHGLYTSCQNR